MTVVATLVVVPRAEGFFASLRHARAVPVVTVDGTAHDAGWGRELRLALAPGTHEVTVHLRAGDSTRAAATTTVELGPAAQVRLDALLDGDTFVLGAS